MKKLILSLVLFVAAQNAQAGERLLDCTISIGNHQQITVVEDKGSLELQELDNNGSMHRRALSQKEFESGKLNLFKDEFGGKNTLTKKDSGWVYFYQLDTLKLLQVVQCK